MAAEIHNSGVVFTVFTPTFNRLSTLPRVYHSLRAAGRTAFEWVVIDDGSNDATENFVKGLIDLADFPITYRFQENRGKHSAHNAALEVARGFLFIVLDSDDELMPGALDRLKEAWDAVPESEKSTVAGILSHSVDESDKIVGDEFPDDGIQSNHFYLHASGAMVGDKLPCYRLDVLRKYRFPEPSIKTVVPEGVVWDKVAHEYNVIGVNIISRRYHRSSTDGASLMNSYKSPASNAYGKMLYANVSLSWAASYWFSFPELFLKSAVSSSRFALHSKLSLCDCLKQQVGFFARGLLIVTFPVAYLLFRVDRFIEFFKNRRT